MLNTPKTVPIEWGTTEPAGVATMTSERRVHRLNYIHQEWMRLDCDAPDKEKARVFALMKELPTSYLSINGDRTQAVAMVRECPMNVAMAAHECVRYYGHLLAPDVAWQGDKWVPMPDYA